MDGNEYGIICGRLPQTLGQRGVRDVGLRGYLTGVVVVVSLLVGVACPSYQQEPQREEQGARPTADERERTAEVRGDFDPTTAGERTSVGSSRQGEEEITSAVSATVRGHYEAIGACNFEEAYSYFGPTYRAQIDKEMWIAREESCQVTRPTINFFEVTKVSETTANAALAVRFENETGSFSRLQVTWKVVKEAGQWKLDKQLLMAMP